MPFDGTTTSDLPKQLPSPSAIAEIASKALAPEPYRFRRIPPWYINRRSERAEAALAVLVRARELITDEQRWCQRSFARCWFDMPVPTHSRFARRFCALGAIKRAGRQLGSVTKEAIDALEWQTVRPVADWNDDRHRTHAEVVAAFDAAILALA